jgi:hypothetical protein
VNLAFLYVAAVYALAIFVARRRVEFRWRVALVFYVVVLATFFKPLNGPYINFAADIVRMIPPWSAEAPLTKYNVSNLEIHDATMQIVPWAKQVRDSWLSGEVPLWNALNGTGYPLLANGQSSALAPVRLLALPLPFIYSIAAEAAMKLLIALTFTFLYLRRRGSSEIASIAGAISFALSTFIVGWVHFPIVTVAVFLPATLFAVDLISERATPSRIAFAAIVSALMVFGGHIETVVHIALLTVIYVIWIRGGWRFLGALAIALIASFLLAAPFLLPFADAVTRSLRFAQASQQKFIGIPYSDLPSLVPMLQPRFFGSRPLPWGPYSCETLAFAGILGVAGFVVAIARRDWSDRRMSFVVAAAISFFVIADWRVISYPAHALLPFVTHGRLRLILCWCAAVFVAMLIDAMHKRVAIAIAAALLAWLLIGWPFPDRVTQIASITAAIPSILVLICAALPARARPIAVAAILIELLAANHNWNPVLPKSAFYPRTPMIDALTKLNRDHSRIAGIGEPLFPNTNAMFGFADIRVHDPMESAAYTSFLAQHVKGYDTSDYYTKINDAESDVFDLLNVRWIVTTAGYAMPSRYRLAYDGRDGRIFENPASRGGSFAVFAAQDDSAFRIGVALAFLTLLALAAAALRRPRHLPDHSPR